MDSKAYDCKIETKRYPVKAYSLNRQPPNLINKENYY